MMSTGAPAMPKELIGMEYWTSLFVQVWISLDVPFFSTSSRFCFFPISSLDV